MDRIDKYKWVEEDQTQGKGKAKAFPKKRDHRGGGYDGNWPRRDFSNPTSFMGAQVVSSLFKEPIYQILEKIKKMNYILNGPIKWVGTHPRETKAFTAIIIRKKDT